MDALLTVVTSIPVGVVIGILAGLLGVGGGMLVIPYCRILMGLPPIMCTGTSLFTIIFTTLSGAAMRIRNKMCIVPLGIAIGIGGALTSPIGVWASTKVPGWVLIVVLVAFQAWSIWQMFSKAYTLTKLQRSAAAQQLDVPGDAAQDGRQQDDIVQGDSGQSPADENLFDPSAGFKPTKTDLAKGVGIGLIAGLASGFVGLGGGFIIVPLTCALMGISVRQVSGTSLIAIAILAIPGTIEHVMLGNIAFAAGLGIIIGSVPAAALGAKIAKRLSERNTRIVSGVFFSIVCVVLLVNEFVIL